MGQLFASAFPIKPGMTDRIRDFQKEVEANWEEYLQRNEMTTCTRHVVFLQQTPMGDLAITVLEAEDMSKMGRKFEDTAYDNWWRDFNKEVHGFDPAEAPAEAYPQVVFHLERP